MPAMRTGTADSDLDSNLGKIYAIYICGFLAISILLLMAEQLSGSSALTSKIFAGLTIALYLLIAVQARNGEIGEFLLAGRAVPAASNGMAAAAIWLSLAASIGLAGTLYASGFDGHAILTGLMAGLVLIGVLIAPYLRKLGAQSVPDFFGARYGRAVQVLTALLLMLSLLALLVAQLMAIAEIGKETFAIPPPWAPWTATLLVAAPVFLGGMKGATWSQVAQYFIALFALLAIVIVAAVQVTGWPIPALSFGEALNRVSALEVELIEKGLADPGTLKPHTAAFLRVDLANYLALTLSVALGTACFPPLLSRYLTTRSVRETRLSVAWSAFFALLIALMLPAYAVYTKAQIYGLLAKETALADLPDWLEPHLRADRVRVHGLSLAMMDEARSVLRSGSQDDASLDRHLKTRAPSSAAAAALLELGEPVRAAVVEAARSTLSVTEQDTWSAFRRRVLPAAAELSGDTAGKLTEGSLWINPTAFMAVAADVARPIANAGGLMKGLATAGALAALLAGASGVLLVLTSALGHDLYVRSADRTAPDQRRLLVLRLASVVFAGAAATLAARPLADYAALAAWSFSLLASALFPALVLGVWWKRTTAWGAAAGMVAGFGVSLYYLAGPQFFPVSFQAMWSPFSIAGEEAIATLETLKAAWAAADGDAKVTAYAALAAHARTLSDWFGINPAAAALFGVPAGFAVAMLVSLLTPRPGIDTLSLVDEMRRAKGEEILPLAPAPAP